MVKLLLIILTFGFVINCAGAAFIVKKYVAETEQGSDENKTGEEKGSKEFKKDKDEVTSSIAGGLSINYSSLSSQASRYFYPAGFCSKHFLPPR